MDNGQNRPKKTNLAAMRGRAAKLYDCFGEQLTAKQAADRLGISIHTLRNRLQLYGDNMEEVMHYYRDQEERKRAKAGTEMTTDEMTEQLLKAISGKADQPPEDAREAETEAAAPETAEPEEEPAPETAVQADPEPAADTPAEAAHSVPEEKQKDAMELCKLNALIAVMESADNVKMDDSTVKSNIKEYADELRLMRTRMYAHLVDWNEIAEQYLPNVQEQRGAK